MALRWAASDILAVPYIREMLVAHVMRVYPNEACALLVAGADGVRCVLAENEADRLHAADPASFPRTAATAFALDPRLIVSEARRGNELVAIVHSHVDVGAYFSAEDRRGATTADGSAPLFPGVAHVVVDARAEGVRGWRIYAWDAEMRAFAEVGSEWIRDDGTGPSESLQQDRVAR
jgi:proteasome lid subunit RPN8/RPN11